MVKLGLTSVVSFVILFGVYLSSLNAVAAYANLLFFPVSFSQPPYSNIYPDSFAIHWYLENDEANNYLKRQKGKMNIQIVGLNLYDDVILETEPVSDTAIYFDFDINEQKIILKGILPGFNNQATSLYTLHRIESIPLIEKLRYNLRKQRTISNYMLLADAYETNECFVNVFYVCQQMVKIDSKAGLKFWQDFKYRNRFKFGTNKAER